MTRYYVVGAGGKTSWIDFWARKFQEEGRHVAIMTTTHRMLPEQHGIPEQYRILEQHGIPERYGIFMDSPSHGDDSDEIEALNVIEQVKTCFLRAGSNGCQVEVGRVVLDKEQQLRMGYSGDAVFEAVSSLADVVLVEADGSKRLPVKVPAAHEPVIFENADKIFVLQGLSAVGKSGKEVCHRWELAKEMLKMLEMLKTLDSSKEERNISLEDIGVLLKYGYLIPLREKFPNTQVIPVLNQADTKEMVEAARHLLLSMGEEEGLIACLKDGVVIKAGEV